MNTRDKNLPNLFIPGAPKSGTTWLASILSQHPDICLSISKEPRFFSSREDVSTYSYGWQYYLKNFNHWDGEKYLCDASTIYFTDPASPRLIHDNCQDPKFIFSLRNPVDRLYSNYWQFIKAGREMEEFDHIYKHNTYAFRYMFEIGLYEKYLSRFSQIFPDESILIILFDDLVDSPEKVLTHVCHWLGIDASFSFKLENVDKNRPAIPKYPGLTRLMKHRALIASVRRILPASLLPLAHRAINYLRKANTVEMEYPYMTQSIRSELIDAYKPSLNHLSEKYKIDLPAKWFEAV